RVSSSHSPCFFARIILRCHPSCRSQDATGPSWSRKDALMVRDGLSLVVCAALFLGIARAGDDRIASTLAVQTALQQGRTQIIRGDFQAAVHTLESQITRIDANPQYLAAMRDAYRGLIKSLKLAGKDDEAAIYARRLQILDPGSSLDFAPLKSAPPKPEEKPAPTAPPARRKIDEPPKPAPPARAAPQAAPPAP